MEQRTDLLVADDSPTIRAVLKKMAEQNGYRVQLAEDGAQAWPHLRSGRFSLAILDWEMPQHSGPDLCRKVQEQRGLPFIYIIILTTREGQGNITAALDAGASDFLSKHAGEGELLARLRAGERLVRMQEQLTAMHKLESIGQLAAGIAHEINTPTQYVGDNVRFLQEAFGDFFQLIGLHQQLIKRTRAAGQEAPLLGQIQELTQRMDLNYLLEEIPRAVDQTLEGVGRVTEIVRSMKDFAYDDHGQRSQADIRQLIRSTCVVARNEWRYVAELDLQLDEELPPLYCLPGDISQAILNLLTNAAYAIRQKLGAEPAEKGRITISANLDDETIVVRVSDTGSGIDPQIKPRIFDPFFTTKPVGVGTGQGLALVHNAVVSRHGGRIAVQSQLGQGSTFTLVFPLHDAAPQLTPEPTAPAPVSVDAA